MSKNIRRDKLVVVSDSAVYKEPDGTYSAFEPVVRELEALCEIFDEIVWLGSITKSRKLALAVPKKKKIKIVSLPATTRSTSFFNKLYIILNYPVFIFKILKHINKAKYVHSRAPSHPAMITIVFSLFDRKRRYWHKYAGNWAEVNPPLGYKWQRSLLKGAHYSNIRVTVNGSWGDRNHVYAFENPCLYESERVAAAENAAQKDYNGELTMIYVGTIEYPHKGILQILDAIEQGLVPDRIKTFYIVGNGVLKSMIEERIANIKNVQVVLLGHMNRAQLDEYYRKSHIIILPTVASEGFPKVIAEGAAYGCIPAVTGISALSQYIKDGDNGVVIDSQAPEDISKALHKLLDNPEIKKISNNAVEMGKKFTYEYYTKRINEEIFFEADNNLQ